MVDPILVSYVKNCLKEGYKLEQVYSELIENGYHKFEVTNTLRYLKINDPALEKETSLGDEKSNFNKEEDETQKRNLVNLIKTGYSPKLIEKDLISSGMSPDKALETVTTLIAPYKDKLDFIGYHIVSLIKEGFTPHQIEISFRKQKIPEDIIRNINNPDRIKEIISNLKLEQEMASYHLGLAQRLFVTLFNPKVVYLVGKETQKFYLPLVEIFRMQITILVIVTLVKLLTTATQAGFNLQQIHWDIFFGDYITAVLIILMAFGYQFASILISTGSLKVISWALRERLSLFESLKISAYSFVPTVIFYGLVLAINRITIDKLIIITILYVCFALWRFVPMQAGIDYYLHTSKWKLIIMILVTNIAMICVELFLGYWNLIITSYR